MMGILVPFESCQGKSVPCLSSSFWWVTGNLWHSLACEALTQFLSSSLPGLLPVCLFVPKFFNRALHFFIRTSVKSTRGSSTPVWLHLKWLHLRWSYFPIKSHSEILGISTSTYEGGGEHSSIHNTSFILVLLKTDEDQRPRITAYPYHLCLFFSEISAFEILLW